MFRWFLWIIFRKKWSWKVKNMRVIFRYQKGLAKPMHLQLINRFHSAHIRYCEDYSRNAQSAENTHNMKVCNVTLNIFSWSASWFWILVVGSRWIYPRYSSSLSWLWNILKSHVHFPLFKIASFWKGFIKISKIFPLTVFLVFVSSGQPRATSSQNNGSIRGFRVSVSEKTTGDILFPVHSTK